MAPRCWPAASAPLAPTLTLTLTLTLPLTKVLACRECTLDLHGRPNLDERVHTKLAATAEAGNSTLTLTLTLTLTQ